MQDGFDVNPASEAIKWILAVLMAVFMAVPSFIVIPMSFSASEFLEFPPSSYSLRWYEYFASSITWTDAARASLIAGVLTTLVSVPIGTMAAYGAMRLSPRLRIIVSGLIVLPAVVPVILIAVGLFFILARLGMIGSMAGLVLGHVSLAIPVVFVVMAAAFSQFDFNEERAARSLGARADQAWRLVVLPQIAGPVAAASLLAFVTSLDEVVIAMFISSGTTATLPKVMFTALRDRIDPTIAVVSTGLLLVATAAVLLLMRKAASSMKS